MSRMRLFLALLLGGTGLTSVPAVAQDVPAATPPTGEKVAEPPAETEQERDTDEEVEISAPGSEGAEIVVTGRFIPEPVRNTGQVVNVLSNAEIERAGEGDIAGALQRVTGLSVNSGGFVYVRGLGDRYSLALLNGLALPSPEPLRRVVPLDIFPTSIVASALVQKSYSANYPGEYGGGVINLTTSALPDENYISLGVGLSGDSETTAKFGYTYYGSETDIFGFDDGTRSLPAALRNNGGELVGVGVIDNKDTLIIQRNYDVPANFSASMSAGYRTQFGDHEFGIVASAGFSNGWHTRGAVQEVAAAGALLSNSYGVRTENRIQANGLIGFGLDLAQGHSLRFTNVYIHDTSKVARVRGKFENVQVRLEDVDQSLFAGPYDTISQETSFVERQLITSQLVGEFEFGDLEFDLRGSYSNSQRNSPYERITQFRYVGAFDSYVVNLASPSGVNFNALDEDVWAGAADVGYELAGDFIAKFSAGYAYSDTARRFDSLSFLYNDAGTSVQSSGFGFLPIYVVLGPQVSALEEITLRQSNRVFGLSRYDAGLTVHAGYARADMELTEGMRLDVGVRFESGGQSLTLPDVYGNNPAGAGMSAVVLKTNDYWLPSATLTYNFAEDFQLRVHGSKTIARPQFRELGTIPVIDVESDRILIGNPFLTDSQLYNAEARIEYYPARGERMSVAGFYKRIDRPIESIATIDPSGQLVVGNANAPKADLYGAEAEVVKFVDLSGLGGGFFATKQIALSANYTYSRSKLRLGAGDTITLYAGNIDNPITAPASQAFTDGSPLTGQSDHLANLQVGIEDTEKLAQLTVMLTYASERVISRGANTGGVLDPDIVERPGLNLDVVMRQGIEFERFPDLELKVEVRNILGTDHREIQRFPSYTVQSNAYRVGTSVGASVSAKF